MGKLADTYLKYGVSSDIALKYESIGLSVTTFRATPISKLIDNYGISHEQASLVKQYITRKPIDEEIVQSLLENSNFVCCCCKGIKSDSYIIHHIVEYETSQDNSYENLAVLCLNDHDLAHRPPKLTNKLSADQIRKSKKSWEQQVRIHNIAISDVEQREKILTKLPKYNELELKIKSLEEKINDKEKIITRSEAFFDTEILKYKKNIEELNNEKAILENQVSSVALKIDTVDLSKSSELYIKAVEHFLNGKVENAMQVLNESQLNAELEKMQQREEKLLEQYEQNADSWILRAQLLTLECKFDKAKQSAEKGLALYEKLFRTNPENYIISLIVNLESIGSIYFNIGEYEVAEKYFNSGLNLCIELRENGDVTHVPILAIIMQNIGACYYAIHKYEDSLGFLEEAACLFSMVNSVHDSLNNFFNPYLMFRYLTVLTNLGTTYKQLNNNEKALESFMKGNEICKELIKLDEDKYSEGIFRNFIGLGVFYFYQAKYKSAQEVYLKALPYVKKLFKKHTMRYIVDLADLLRDICATYIFEGNFKEAKPFCNDTLELFRQIGASRGDKVQMHMVDTIVYKMLICIQEDSNKEAVEKLAQDALEICAKYPDNVDAQEYPKTINAILKSLESKKM